MTETEIPKTFAEMEMTDADHDAVDDVASPGSRELAAMPDVHKMRMITIASAAFGGLLHLRFR